MNFTDITPIAIALIALATACASVVVVPWLRSTFDAQEMANLLRWTEIAVAAAEQLYSMNDGKQKKRYVRNFLESKGYTFNAIEIENAIEAAVLKLHNDLYNYGGDSNDKQP